MNSPRTRFQRLQPLSIEQQVHIALAALRFFQPMRYEENCQKLGRLPEPHATLPFNSIDFIRFLAIPDEIPSGMLDNPMCHLQRVNELLCRLKRAGFLNEQGSGRSPLVGESYFTLYMATNYEMQGILHLARALGPQLLPWIYRRGTYQITGITADGDHHAGTAIAIAPQWLMTCAHVLQDMAVDERQVASDGRDYLVVRKLLHSDVDVGLIEVDIDLDVVQGLNFRDPHVGERVYTFGFPRVPLSREAILVMQGGEVSVEQITSLDGNELFLYSAIARPGNSGGPIISENGHVVGIVSRELSERDSNDHPFHAGIPTDTLARAINELNCGVNIPVETWE